MAERFEVLRRHMDAGLVVILHPQQLGPQEGHDLIDKSVLLTLSRGELVRDVKHQGGWHLKREMLGQRIIGPDGNIR